MNALSAANSSNAINGTRESCIGGSLTSFLRGMADRVLGPKLNPDDPPPPVDRNFEPDPHVIQWPPQADNSASPDSPSSSTPTATTAPPPGAVPCSSVLDPSPTSGDPIVCAVQNSDPEADQQLIRCDKEVTVGDQSYCVPSR